jgi:hypothetical protein
MQRRFPKLATPYGRGRRGAGDSRDGKDGDHQLVVLVSTDVPSQPFLKALAKLVATAYCS